MPVWAVANRTPIPLGEGDAGWPGHSSLPVSAPWNEFGYARELLGPETTFVTPNNDTL
jgi:hypothetical protein